MDRFEDELDVLVRHLIEINANQAIKSLMTVCLNLIEHPKDERMRTLRTANSTVSRTLLAFPEAILILKKLGFIEVDGFLSLIGNDVSLFQIAISVLSRHRTARKNNRDRANGAAQTPPLETSNSNRTTTSHPLAGFQRIVSPTQTWQDVLDLKLVKNQLKGPPPFGECLLIYGASGSGKTLVAHAAAEAWGLRVFTIYGCEIQTPFAKSRHQLLKHFLRHAFEVGPCLILLREMDNILAEVVEEVRVEFTAYTTTNSHVVVMATCNSTNELLKSSPPHCSLPRRLSKMDLKNRSCQPPIVASDNMSSSHCLKDNLTCFDHLIHVPTLNHPSSISLVLQTMIEKNGGVLPTSVSRIICTIIGSYTSNGEISGHLLSNVAKTAIELSQQRQFSEPLEASHVHHMKKVVITADVLRKAFKDAK